MVAGRSARERVRAELTKEIVTAAFAELTETGPATLSLRAVARRMEMVPSALYRYFPNRDALLTALIIECYETIGAVAEQADEEAGPRPSRRWAAVANAVREWAQEHPHEWALVYGSPVPGYEAPATTVPSAIKVTRVIAGIFSSARPLIFPKPPASFAAVVKPIQQELFPGEAPLVVAAAFMAWTQLMGTVSLELFGHFVGATTDFDPMFSYLIASIGHLAGLK